jgi:DNA repair protein RecO (recombination protein O)
MRLSDTGIILSKQRYQDKNLILQIFTYENGVYRGFAKNGSGSSKFEVGNKLEINWYARLPEQLGSFSKCELVKHNSAVLFSEPLKLLVLQCACELFSRTLNEREAYPKLFHSLDEFLSHLVKDEIKDHSLMAHYIFLELELLYHIGFGLDFSCCAGNGSKDNLAFVSPRTGRAVSQEMGQKYRDRLLKLPQFLIRKDDTPDNDDIKSGLDLTSYFLSKQIKVPLVRNNLAGRLVQV